MVKKFNTLFSFVHSVVKSVHVGSETKDAPQAQSGLHSRLSSQLKACSAAALLAVGGLADADAAVVHWQNANLLIPNTIDGLYINVETQATGSAGSVVAGWDINPYSATSLTWFNATGTGMMRFPGATTGSAGNLAQGTVIGGAGVTNNGFATSFGSGAVTVGSAPGNWQLNASNYFGFRFKGADGGTKYGWGRFVIGASISGADRMIAEIAYESSGASIVVGVGAVISCTAPSLSGLVTDAGCSGATNGGVDLTATGGSPTPLSYLWSNGAITEDLLNVGPGTYSVTVTAGTCSTSASYTVGTAAQAPQPTGLACYETATYNNTTCQWDVSGTQPAQPSIACYETASFNTTTCSWDVSGTQPAQPSIACYETASFNTTTCSWDVSGTQPAQPSIACYETASFNTTTCSWDVSGTQPAQPSIACYETASFNTTTCSWVVSGTQPAQPSLACYETASFNSTTCSWDVSGTQPAQPTLACYETASFNTTTCSWDVSGTQPAQPSLACYETASFNTTTCSWDVSGTQPAQPSLACYETASFNTTTCSWDVSGTQPAQPSIACYETASFNTTTCSWDVSGTQPAQPSIACYETASFNTTTCSWDVSGTQPAQPSLACYETASFNTTTCSWDVSGTQPAQPSLACYETASFNTTTCSWDVSGTQPAQPTGLASWQTATFNTTTCQWDVSGTPPSAPVGGTVVYDNSASSPMRNAVVVLKQGNTEVVRDTTDATGAFLLPLVAAGNYDVVVTPNTPWGGVNATDAIIIINHYSNRLQLSGIRLTAADVNGSQSLNATDALNTMQRFTGALQTFSVGNYAASTSSYTATGTGTGSLNVSMLCYGDVNASYQPNGGFVRTSWKDLSTQGVARITSGSYEVPLFVSRGVQPAGVSLELELPEGLRVLGVRASEGLRANQVVYHQEGNRVRMAWLDESGAELKAGDVLCYVQVEGSTEGVWRSSTEVELANVLGEVQPGVELRMPKLSSSLGVMEASVYPNPGRGLRTLSLELSEGMGVAVRVTDALGRTVYTHTAGTLASGTHFLELNMEGWPVGSYQVQVLGATAGGKTHQRSITVLQTR